MLKNRTGRVIVVVCFALTLAACGDGADSSDDAILIGYAAAVTGGLAPYDTPGGVECEIENVNDAGGVLGRPLELDVRDMQSDPALAATVGQELLDAGANVIFSGPTDDVSIPIAELAKPLGVAVLSVEATQPAFPLAAPDNGFMIFYGDNFSAAAVAEFAYDEGVRTVYILTSPDLGSYAILNPQWFGESIEELGGEVVGEASWNMGVGDFSPQITEIASLDPAPDAIYMAAAVPDNAQLVKQLRDAGIDIPVYGGDGFDDPTFLEVAGDAAEGATFSAAGFPPENPDLAAWIDDCRARGYEIGNTGNAAGGDAVRVVVAAIEAAGSAEPSAITAALKELEGVKGVLSDSITYAGQPINMPEKEIVIVRIVDGEPELQRTFSPVFVPDPSGN